MTAVFRWYAIGPDRYVVTGGSGTGVLVGYVGTDAARKARDKAEALATWSLFLGHGAVVLDCPPRLDHVEPSPRWVPVEERHYSNGGVWSKIMAHD